VHTSKFTFKKERKGKMKKTISTILIALIAFAAVTMVTLSGAQAETILPTLTTDKTDYAPMNK